MNAYCDECEFRKQAGLVWNKMNLCEPCYAQYDYERLNLDEILTCENCAEDFTRGEGYTDDHNQEIIYCCEDCYRLYRKLCMDCGEPDLEGENRCHSGEYDCQTCYEIKCENACK
jgi:hypothetical protein